MFESGGSRGGHPSRHYSERSDDRHGIPHVHRHGPGGRAEPRDVERQGAESSRSFCWPHLCGQWFGSHSNVVRSRARVVEHQGVELRRVQLRRVELRRVARWDVSLQYRRESSVSRSFCWPRLCGQWFVSRSNVVRSRARGVARRLR